MFNQLVDMIVTTTQQFRIFFSFLQTLILPLHYVLTEMSVTSLEADANFYYLLSKNKFFDVFRICLKTDGSNDILILQKNQ